jgi:hypothetical protein
MSFARDRKSLGGPVTGELNEPVDIFIVLESIAEHKNFRRQEGGGKQIAGKGASEPPRFNPHLRFFPICDSSILVL